MSKRPTKKSPEMATEYDFADGVRGQFYRKGAILVPPVHLEPKVLAYLQSRAAAKGTTLNQLVNALLKKDIELIEAAE